jgi:hypothetical protein
MNVRTKNEIRRRRNRRSASRPFLTYRDRNVFRRMGKIGVHFDDIVRAEGESGFESVDAAGPAAAALGPDEGVDTGIRGRAFLDVTAGAVGRIIVGHEDVDFGLDLEGEQGVDQVGDVLPLVVGRDHRHEAGTGGGVGHEAATSRTASRT